MIEAVQPLETEEANPPPQATRDDHPFSRLRHYKNKFKGHPHI
jgi:hypothetical protein